jgi:hypothetical protein
MIAVYIFIAAAVLTVAGALLWPKFGPLVTAWISKWRKTPQLELPLTLKSERKAAIMPDLKSLVDSATQALATLREAIYSQPAPVPGPATPVPGPAPTPPAPAPIPNPPAPAPIPNPPAPAPAPIDPTLNRLAVGRTAYIVHGGAIRFVLNSGHGGGMMSIVEFAGGGYSPAPLPMWAVITEAATGIEVGRTDGMTITWRWSAGYNGIVANTDYIVAVKREDSCIAVDFNEQ